ncbi:hypothetical protein F5Y14DRAFT_457096 [Nemania sp. NC0429]|nr:hypothetical protein F5Y14DRAFT_457096 [Nemania sp. NC0429]
MSSTSTSTDLAVITVPTATLISGPAETTEAVAAAAVLIDLWSKRSWLQDKTHKKAYINQVKKNRDTLQGIFNRLEIRPLPKPECNKTTLKRSLISGILDTFKRIADLFICAINVLDNLAEVVNKIDPPILQIDLLTDTLKDLGNELNKRGKEDPDHTVSSNPSSTTPSSSASSPSTSSSSCTATLTRTWESVLCTVTATPSANKRQDQGCTTEVYSTVTGCNSVIASTVTSTTTTTPKPTPIPQCKYGECGIGVSCSQREGNLRKRQPQRLTEPEPNTWAGPENYGGISQHFMAGETWRAYEKGDIDNKHVNLAVGTTSSYVVFGAQAGSLAVAGLYGCTSVIAVSKRGAWVSHHWEAPSFTSPWEDYFSPPTALEQLEIFRESVLRALHEGKGNDHLFGLGELRSKSAPDTMLLSHLMDDEADPRVFIFAPYMRADLGDPNYNNEFPVGLPEAWGQDDGLPSKNQQIQNEIRAIFNVPSGFVVPYEKVLYAPLVGGEGVDLGDKDFNSNRGKVLVQYQPAKSCHDKASWRVWFEGHDGVNFLRKSKYSVSSNSLRFFSEPKHLVDDMGTFRLYKSKHIVISSHFFNKPQHVTNSHDVFNKLFYKHFHKPLHELP